MNLGTDHPLVRARDGVAVWLTWYDISMKDAKNFAYLAIFIASNSVTLSTIGLQAFVVPVTVGTVLATIPAVWLYVRVLKLPNEKERREKHYKSNYTSPGRAINAHLWAALVRAHQRNEDPFEAVDRVLSDYNRGIDMAQFDRPRGREPGPIGL